jgi:hypothetical protein
MIKSFEELSTGIFLIFERDICILNNDPTHPFAGSLRF